MCAWWMYKCNSRAREYQAAYGDWRDLFGDTGQQDWGKTDWVADFRRLRPGDRVFAYQTDRNELAGVAEVVGLGPDADGDGDEALWLRPLEALGVKVRPLKKADAAVAAIPALEQGPVRTIYAMTAAEARLLLTAAREAVERPERQFLEGERRAAHAAVRSAALRAAAKRYWGCRCYCCGFDFEEFYGPIGRGVAVVHHLHPFEAGDGARAASVQDVRVVCDNCHRVLHLRTPPLDVDALREQLGRPRGGAAQA